MSRKFKSKVVVDGSTKFFFLDGRNHGIEGHLPPDTRKYLDQNILKIPVHIDRKEGIDDSSSEFLEGMTLSFQEKIQTGLGISNLMISVGTELGKHCLTITPPQGEVIKDEKLQKLLKEIFSGHFTVETSVSVAGKETTLEESLEEGQRIRKFNGTVKGRYIDLNGESIIIPDEFKPLPAGQVVLSVIFDETDFDEDGILINKNIPVEKIAQIKRLTINPEAQKQKKRKKRK